MSTIPYSKGLAIRHEVDIFVGGGGPAGPIAAITAARDTKGTCTAKKSACPATQSAKTKNTCCRHFAIASPARPTTSL